MIDGNHLQTCQRSFDLKGRIAVKLMHRPIIILMYFASEISRRGTFFHYEKCSLYTDNGLNADLNIQVTQAIETFYFKYEQIFG